MYYLSRLIFFFFRIFFLLTRLIFLIVKNLIIIEWNVLIFNRFIINILIFLDWIRLIFIFTVSIIFSIIVFYRSEYIIHDINKNRFLYLLIFFVVSIILIILRPNLIRILIGWDGLGLISYCLVIYYQNFSSYNSGILTILINRIGDVFILIRIGLIITKGRWNFLNFNNIRNLVLILLVLAAFTKRAQFPFRAWLPAAIAAPTPVSALVHSSTLVTAGIYLLIRFNYLIFKRNLIRNYLIFTGLITIVFAGLAANFEFDFKKIIAYSTLSQLGLILIILGFKNFELTYFHLIIHAIFKSIIFICSGVFIHCINNYQDIRIIGYVRKFLPLTRIIFLISNLSLCGIPFFSGFYSKDQILEDFIINYFYRFRYILIILGTGLTVIYRIRLNYYLINNSFNFNTIFKFEDNLIINRSIIILLIFTLILGYYINWLMFSIIEVIYIKISEKLFILIICLLFLFFRKYLHILKLNFTFIYKIKYFFGKLWFLYNLNFILIKNFLKFGIIYLKIFDKGIVEILRKELLVKNSLNFNLILNLNYNYLINLILMIRYIYILFYIIF